MTVALAATALPTGRLRHLALPVIHDPSVHPDAARIAARLDIADGAIGEATERTQLPARISAILPRADGVVFIGTFDGGLFRFDPARDSAPREIAALDGRERFVDALAEWNGHVVAATHRGAVVLAPDGARAGVLAAGQAVSSLAVAGDELVLGTAHGLWRGRDDVAVGERGPDGEILRVTALAATGDHVWIGTPDGVYEVRAPLRAQAALWHPLVFGSPGATSNVVTALALAGDGVVAGTDDGGLVFVDDRGVDAAPLRRPSRQRHQPRRARRARRPRLRRLRRRRPRRARRHARARPPRRPARAASPPSPSPARSCFFGSEEGALYVTPSPRPGSSG